MKRQLAITLATLLLAGCGGGGNTTPGTGKAQPQSVKGSVVISIPSSGGQASSSKVRYPQFVSPNAQSVAVSINGGAGTVYDVAPGSSLCTTVAGARNCTLSFGAPVGSDTFVFLIFSAANGTGTQLASATTTQSIAAGTAFNFTVALNAAVGSIVVGFTPPGGGNCQDAPMNFNGFNEGCAGSGPLTITVDDPSGAQITGSAPFATPLQITTNEPTITVSPATMTAPNQTVTMSYAGVPWQSITNSFQVNITAGGQTGSLSIVTEQSNLYVANSNASGGSTPPGGGNVAVYRFGATSPLRTLTGGLSNPVQPMLDSSGNLWVLDNGPYTTTSHPYINVYAPGATGAATPIKQITNLAGVDSTLACEAMTFTPNQSQLFVSCDDQAIHVFPTNFTGTATAASLQTVSMNDDSWGGPPVGMAFDNSGNLYVAQPNANEIGQYVVSSLPTSNVYQPIVAAHYMSGGFGPWPSNVAPLDVYVDNSGTLYSSIVYYNSPTQGPPDANNQVAIWNTTAIPCSNCSPSATLGGAPFTTHAPAAFTFDPPGNLYVSNPFTNTVSIFARATYANASGNVTGPAVLRTINTGSSPSAPTGMTVGP